MQIKTINFVHPTHRAMLSNVTIKNCAMTGQLPPIGWIGHRCRGLIYRAKYNSIYYTEQHLLLIGKGTNSI